MQMQYKCIDLAEKLMQRGWWDEALTMIHDPSVSKSDQRLESALLSERRDCVQRAVAMFRSGVPLPEIVSVLREEYDIYTLLWVSNIYCGDGAEIWRGANAKESDPTD